MKSMYLSKFAFNRQKNRKNQWAKQITKLNDRHHIRNDHNQESSPKFTLKLSNRNLHSALTSNEYHDQKSSKLPKNQK